MHAIHALFHFILKATLLSRYSYYPHFENKKTKLLNLICIRSRSWGVVEARFSLCSVASVLVLDFLPGLPSHLHLSPSGKRYKAMGCDPGMQSEDLGSSLAPTLTVASPSLIFPISKIRILTLHSEAVVLQGRNLGPGNISL